MARPENYYDNRINELSQPQQSTQDVVAPSVTQDNIYKNIYQNQLKTDTEYWSKQANRHWTTRVPYEVQNSLFNMPEEREWNENYNFIQKNLHLQKETWKFVGKTIKNLPREILKAPLKLEQSFYDLAASTVAGFTPGQTREDVMSNLGRDESYNLPWLGEVRGFAGSYQEGRDMGINPFFSAVKATGEFAGDLAISYSLLEAGIAATRPRMTTAARGLKVTGEDFRPLTAEQFSASKGAGKVKMVNGEMLTLKQNPNVSYIKLPKSTTKVFKGNPNNTFLRVSPLGKGKAEFSIVQIRKSLTSQTKDWFASKFGRSAVVEGPFGPELKLQSGIINYDSQALVKQGSSAESLAVGSKAIGAEGVAGGVVAAAGVDKIAPIRYNVGITTATDKVPEINTLMNKATELENAGNFDEANIEYDKVLDTGQDILQNLFKDTDIKIEINRSKGNFFGYTKPTFLAEAYVQPKDFNEFVSRLVDVSDLSFKQDNLHISKIIPEVPEGVTMGVALDNGIVHEPDFNIYFNKKLSDAEVLKLNKTLQDIGLTGSTLHADNGGLNLYNISKFKNYDEFKQQITKFTESIPGELVRGIEWNIRELRNYGDEGYGATRTYDEIRSEVRGKSEVEKVQQEGSVPDNVSKEAQSIDPFLQKKPATKPVKTTPGVKELDEAAKQIYIKRHGQEDYDEGVREGAFGLEKIEQFGREYNEEFIKKHPELKDESIIVYHDATVGEDLAVVHDNKVIEVYSQDIIDYQHKSDQPEPFYPMKKPLKGFGDEMVTEKQVNKIIELSQDVDISDFAIQAVSKALTGKNNIYNLTQDEAYDVSEAIKMFAPEKTSTNDDFLKLNRSFTHPARYWMEAAERELGYPIYSDVYIPIETGGRLMGVFNDRWQGVARENFGKYSKPKYVEERRMITEYVEGNKNAITGNKSLTPEAKKELIKVGDWLVEQYKLLFKDLGISSERFFSVYSPKIRKIGGIHNLYKTDELPVEIKPFFEFEREGMLDPIEDDALALFDIYTRAIGKKTFIHDALEGAKKVTEKLPDKLRKATNSYLQEKIGFKDGVEESFNTFAEKLNKNTNGIIPKNIFKQAYDFLMTTSYAGALGLPRIMPIFRNLSQTLLTTYPEVGPKYFIEGVKKVISDPEASLKELKDKGMLVKMGVPYGSEISGDSGQGVVGKLLDVYKNINRATMKPYGGIDAWNRLVTYFSNKARFEDNWLAFRDDKITYEQFEQNINMDGMSPTLQKILRGKFQQNTAESLEEAQDLMVTDLLDRTQFPYRKGAESRLHYGLGGKLGLQFGQWTWEYVFTLKSWISRGQWEKLIRWFGMSSAVKRTAEDTFGVDVSKWVGRGPLSGFPLGPIAKMAASFGAGVGDMMTGMSEDLNDRYKEIWRALQIYGGVLTGVGAKRIKDFNQSMKRFDAGIAVSPDPQKPIGVWSSTGKLIRWVDFTDRLKILLGFDTPEGQEQSDKINRIKQEGTEYSNNINKAMNYLVDGNYENFDKMVTKHNLIISDISAKLKSYQIPLDQRIFERMPIELKIKYFNAFYPTE